MLRWITGAALAALALWLPAEARAQSYVNPLNLTPVACKGGTASAITSVGTTAITVCAAASATAQSGVRQLWRITAVGGTAGQIALLCTDDGSTPSASNYNQIVYALGMTDSGGQAVVSPAAIQCISNTGGSVTITAYAVQVGVP